MNRYLNEALHTQLPPDCCMDELSTKVKAKKKDAAIPITIGFTSTSPQFGWLSQQLPETQPIVFNETSDVVIVFKPACIHDLKMLLYRL